MRNTDHTFIVTESRGLELRYDDECPYEIRSMIAPYLERFSWILPTYIHFIFVRFGEQPEGVNAVLSMQVDEEYRKAIFSVHPNFLVATERDREIDVRHEFVHALTDHLHTFAHQTIKAGNFEKRQEDWLREELRKALERTTCDIEHMIDGRLRGEQFDREV